MNETEVREALNRHWAASDANDFVVEHDIYREDALLEYPQSGERIRGRHNIQAARETLYFGDPFEPGPSRAQWVERMD
jgi:ketosteroid isomerase-like protein